MSLRLAFVFACCASTLARAQTDSTRSQPIAPLVRVPANTWGAGGAVIDSAEISASTAPTFSQLLEARRPGLRVLNSGGLASDGALVMLRGPTSLLGSNAPVLIVDGVRVDSRQYDQPLGIGATSPSRFDDLMPEDIERIEVLSGAAAALYGDGAANGVILVTTKSGGPGPLRIRGRFTYSAAQNSTGFPANYQRVGTSPSTGQPVADCRLLAVAAGTCTPTELNVWNPLEQASPFRTGNAALGHLALGGTTFGTSIAAALTGTGRQGVLPHDGIDRVGGRARVMRELPGHFNVEASGGSLREHARSAVDGNIALEANVIGNGLVGFAEDGPSRGYYGPGSTDSVFPARRLSHNTGGVTLRWRPAAWLQASAMTGRDLVTEHWHADHIGVPTQVVFDHRLVEQQDMRTSGGKVTLSYSLGSAIAGSTSAGLERDVLQTATFDSIGDPTGPFSFSESRFHVRSTAFHLTESLHLPRQVHANFSAARVTSTLFGSRGGKEWFPSGNVSWLPSFDLHAVSALRLRAAYAEAPGASTSPPSLGGVVVPPFPAPPPPPPPSMERTKSLEIGGEATIGRVMRVELTAFSDRSTKLWAITPQLGAAQVGAMTNKGIETVVHTTLLTEPILRWEGMLSLGLFRNRVTGLQAAPPGGTIRNPVSNGYSFGGVWAQTYTYADVNHDGIIAANEVQLGPAQYAGAALPTLESAFANEISLPGHVVLSAVLDYRHGNHALDLTGRYRCEALVCRETQDPTAPLDRQAAYVASTLSAYAATGFVSDASFVRIREIAFRWIIPPAGSRYLGVDADLTVAGRNLATWTNYRGLDPEISYQSPDVLPRQEFLTLPVPRELVVRLDVRP